jgi:hypothetical protein
MCHALAHIRFAPESGHSNRVVKGPFGPKSVEVPSMQMKIGRWEGLYPRIQSAAKHVRCGFVCGYRKIAGPFRSKRSAIIGAAQPGVHGPDPSEDRATKKEREQ